MVFAVVLVVAAAALDLWLAARGPHGRVTGPGSFIAFAATLGAIVAALSPIGLLIPEPTLSHVAPVPSLDSLQPCLPPPLPSGRGHAVLPFALLRLVLPLGAAVAIAARPLPRARALLSVSFALALAVLAASTLRLLRGGVAVSEIATCGAFTPEQGFDGRAVRALLDRVNREGRQELVRFRELPRLPPPPWVRAEIGLTIAGEPWSLRLRGTNVVAEPDDPRRAQRPMPALHLASIPSIERGVTLDGHGASVLVDRRSDGRWYAVRLGRPLSFAELAPIARPPGWPVALLLCAVLVAIVALRAGRSRPPSASPLAPYRTSSDENPARGSVVPALCALLLVEATFTVWRVIGPYLR